MSLYTYTATPNSNLICCICRTPFTDPATTSTCAHTFCRECITRALSHSSQCPVDRSPLTLSNIGPSDPIVRSLVDELEVECVHHSAGCVFIGQRQLLAAHLKEECLYAEVACDLEGCVELIPRREMKEHALKVHGDQTKESVVDEPGETEMEDERSPEGPKPPSRPPSPTPCQTCAPRLSRLTEHNVLLQHRVGTLESAVTTLKRDMATARGALGPWFRVDGGPRVGVVPPVYGVAAGNVVAQDSNGAGPSEFGGMGVAAGSSGVGSGSTGTGISGEDPLAVYFPEERWDGYSTLSPIFGFGSPSVPGQGSPHGAPGVHASHQHHACASVAPLDLGASLEGTLRGLRESVVGVAAGVDSLGRRSEIALANETLRLGEEVMSLRAGVHGLRMQIHALMMDRNGQVTGGEGMWGNIRPMYFGMQGHGPSITKL